jgi:hypothetical protein
MNIPDPDLDFLPIPDPEIKKHRIPDPSVADQGFLSRIPDPDFYPSRIPDLRSRIQKQQQKTGVKKIFLSNHFL